MASPIAAVPTTLSDLPAMSRVRKPGGENLLDGRLDRAGRFLVLQRMAQQHRRRENLRDRVGDVLAGDVGRGAAGRFVQAETARR